MKKKFTLFSLFFFCYHASYTQQQPAYNLQELLQLAEKNYPAVAAKKAQSVAAEKNIGLQKSNLVPTLDAAYQVNYATYNNITGMALSQYMVPISGPPSSSNDYSGVFGSAAHILMNWQPLTFGQRQSQIDAAIENYKLAVADENITLYQLKINLISTYLNIVYADELTKVYQKNIQRIHVQLTQISSFVKSGLRPGTDTSLFQAELSKGTIDLYNVQLYRTQQLNNLKELTGISNLIFITDSLLTQRLPAFGLSDTVSHPLIQYNKQLIRLSEANKKAIQKTVMPKLSVWSTAYSRGSGVKYDGTVKSSDGFQLSRNNYGVGLQLSIPILQFTHSKWKVQQQEAFVQNYQFQLAQTQLQLQKDSMNAAESYSKAIQIVQETPVELKAATEAYNATLSRYNAGLSSFADLIQAQYALLQAETHIKQSYLNVWKAFLQQSAAKGDLTIFLNQIK
jgi:outer membrane protein TolC